MARYVAENFDSLPKPYRSYRAGYVYRHEKPGPVRFRRFMQLDADTVGSASPAADAEMCMMAADTMEALGIPRGSYVVKVNNRKVLDGVMDAAQIFLESRLTVLRAIDKLDRLGIEGVKQLLGAGRKDESGDFTKGAGLNPDATEKVISFVHQPQHMEPTKFPPTPGAGLYGRSNIADYESNLDKWERLLAESQRALAGVSELHEIAKLLYASGDRDRVEITAEVVRALEYYTCTVFEVELTLETKDEKGRPVRFGSVGGGCRYDGLVSRFGGEPVAATV